MCEKYAHTGCNNIRRKYEVNGGYLEEVIEERDLGVIMQPDELTLNSGILDVIISAVENGAQSVRS